VALRAADPDGVAALRLWYLVQGGAWTEVAMAPAAVAGLFTGRIPGQSAARVVQFYVEGTGRAPARLSPPPAATAARSSRCRTARRASAARSATCVS
jgi:hypothetical protein